MLSSDLFVEFHAQTRLRGWDDVSLLPADGLRQDLRVEAVPPLDAFLNQKVGAACIDLDGRGALNGAAI